MLRLFNNNNEFMIDGVVITPTEEGETLNKISFAEFEVESRNVYFKFINGEKRSVDGDPVIHTVRVFGDLIDHALNLDISDPVRIYGHFRNIDKNNDIKTVVSWHKVIYGNNLTFLRRREEEFNNGLNAILSNNILGFNGK